MEAINGYKTEDGLIFEKEADAIEHEEELELTFQVDVFIDGHLSKEDMHGITRNKAHYLIYSWMKYNNFPIVKINTEA